MPAGGEALRSDRDVALRELLVRRARESLGGESWEACTLVSAALRRGLASREQVGRLDEERSEGASTTILQVGDGARSVELPEPFEEPRAIRVADLVAVAIAPSLGVGFSLGWTRERRDAAIADVRRRLARYPGKIVQR